LEIKNFIRISLPIIIFLFSSCYTENKPSAIIPNNLFSETKMIAVMTDVQIVEGALTYKRTKTKNIKNYKEPYYNQIFIEYNITANDLKQNLNYYNSDPELMEKIIDQVLENLNQIQGQLEKKIAEEKIADSIRMIEKKTDSLRVADSLMSYN